MAEYKEYKYLSQSNDEKYEKEYSPGDTAIYAGIYRCKGCNDEIGIAKGHTLPPQTADQHGSSGKVIWKLIVRAQQK